MKRRARNSDRMQADSTTPVAKLEVRVGQSSLAPRTVYEFKAIKGERVGKRILHHSLDEAVTKVTVLLSRASGRDKLASFIQYFSLFYGTNPLSKYYVPLRRRGVDEGSASWERVEESMSSGRKVLRLLKWVLELQRCRASFKQSEPLLRYLAVMMHAFSAVYYFVDNLIWSSNVGLINKSPSDSISRRLLAKPRMSYEDFEVFQTRRRKILLDRAARASRVNGWKDIKNWSSLGRLILAIVYCLMQLNRVETKRRRRSTALRNDDDDDNGDNNNNNNDNGGKHGGDESSMEKITKEKEELDSLETLHRLDLGFAVANLGILLQRLKIGPFARLPVWSTGIFGMIAGAIGIRKNLPSRV